MFYDRQFYSVFIYILVLKFLLTNNQKSQLFAIFFNKLKTEIS